MVDYFALLQEPRLPWLDPDELKAKFLELSSQAHPDRVHAGSEEEKAEANRRYAEFNSAYNTLREPKNRLLHLLELETGGKPADIQRIPPGTMDLFVEVGQTCREADAFLAERLQVTSPMLRVQLFEKGMEWTDRLTALQNAINQKRQAWMAELQQMNEIWKEAPSDPVLRTAKLPLERLEQLYRGLSYVARWTAQIQERVVQLSL
jgi:curved DNA-binding protein CbpA